MGQEAAPGRAGLLPALDVPGACFWSASGRLWKSGRAGAGGRTHARAHARGVPRVASRRVGAQARPSTLNRAGGALLAPRRPLCSRTGAAWRAPRRAGFSCQPRCRPQGFVDTLIEARMQRDGAHGGAARSHRAQSQARWQPFFLGQSTPGGLNFKKPPPPPPHASTRPLTLSPRGVLHEFTIFITQTMRRFT